MGIYIGGGQFIHAPHTGDVVKISSMTGYYSSNYVGARRV
jgi:cell wall-associated NlpC family hydrolase